MCLLSTNTKRWNIERREAIEIFDYNAVRRDYIRQLRLHQISANTFDDLERSLSEAHLERLRKIRKGK